MSVRFDALRADTAFALRLWRRNPGWTAVAVLSIALGIGANAVVFSIVDAVLLHPFPYRDSDRLVFLWGAKSPTVTPGLQVDLREWRETSQTFAGADVFLGRMSVSLGSNESDTVPAACIGPGILSILGVQPALGVNFAEHAARQREGLVILSDALCAPASPPIHLRSDGRSSSTTSATP